VTAPNSLSKSCASPTLTFERLCQSQTHFQRAVPVPHLPLKGCASPKLTFKELCQSHTHLQKAVPHSTFGEHMHPQFTRMVSFSHSCTSPFNRLNHIRGTRSAPNASISNRRCLCPGSARSWPSSKQSTAPPCGKYTHVECNSVKHTHVVCNSVKHTCGV